MSLDANEMKMTKTGTVEMRADGSIYLQGFDGEGCTCRDLATMALVWAIGKLQEELMWQLRQPGGSGNVCID